MPQLPPGNGSAENVSGRAPHADRGLHDRAEPQHELREGAVTQAGADEFAQPAKLKRLAVQRRRDPVRAGGKQDPLQCLSGIHPVR